MTRHRWHLPPWDLLRHTILWASVVAAWFAFVYLGGDWWTSQHDFRVRVHADAELRMPFVPAMALAYLSLNPLMALAPFIVPSKRELTGLALSLVAATSVAGAFFIALPVEAAFPPIDWDALGPWRAVNRLAATVARPNNFLPSLHVAFATICVLVYGDGASLAMRAFFGLWWGLIVAATLLIHQHYILDVVTGAALGWAVARSLYQRWSRAERAAHRLPMAETRLPIPAAHRAPSV